MATKLRAEKEREDRLVSERERGEGQRAVGQGEEGAKKEEEDRKFHVSGRGYAPPVPLSSFSSSTSFAFLERASPTTTRRCSSTVRFTYKFNKHISYLMHALSRECFARPVDHLPLLLSGPLFLRRSTRALSRHSPNSWFIAHFLLLDCAKYF